MRTACLVALLVVGSTASARVQEHAQSKAPARAGAGDKDLEQVVRAIAKALPPRPAPSRIRTTPRREVATPRYVVRWPSTDVRWQVTWPTSGDRVVLKWPGARDR